MFMACLIIAGEAIFSLPFHVARFFRPTVLSVLDFTNTELGAVQAVYGVTAMLAYFPGGPLADRFSARKLLALSLVSTSLGGLVFATFPGYRGMWLLFGYFGFSTILLFWASLIRATRDWGSEDKQGRAYGILDGGRGLLAAAMATGAALLLALTFPEDAASVTPEQRRTALRTVIYAYSAVTSGAAVLCWFFVPERGAGAPTTERQSAAVVYQRIVQVMRLPAVWLQALIIISAYVAFKGFDNYSLFAHEVYGMSEVEVGTFTANMQWIRPVAAVGAGLLGDRFRCSRVVIVGFVMILFSNLFFALAEPNPSAIWLLTLNVAITSTAMFGLRGVYFALFEESSVPIVVTGTAVGLVSVIGYTPDVFVSLIAGILLDRTPGVAGHQHFFFFLAAFGVIGLVATMLFQRVCRRQTDP